jgi:hypothetical protein
MPPGAVHESYVAASRGASATRASQSGQHAYSPAPATAAHARTAQHRIRGRQAALAMRLGKRGSN